MPSEDRVNWAEATESSWADQVDEADLEETGKDKVLPQPTEKIDGNTKIVTEYKINEDGKKVKIVRTYKVEKQKTSKLVARRKLLPKFGMSKDDSPGPNRATTIISEDVNMQFIDSRQEEIHDQEDPMISKFRNQLQYYMFFKNFKTISKGSDKEEDDKKEEGEAAAPLQSTNGKYVPPSLRGGGNTRGSSMPTGRGARDEQATIRVTNLSEETKESDLQELFRPFGPIQRIYLAKDKHTQQSKGFAFINFYKREDAAKAIKAISGFGYDHLILNVEWAKPSTPVGGGP